MEEVQIKDETLSRHSRHTEVDDWHHLSNYCHTVLFTQKLQSQWVIIWVGFKSLTRLTTRVVTSISSITKVYMWYTNFSISCKRSTNVRHLGRLRTQLYMTRPEKLGRLNPAGMQHLYSNMWLTDDYREKNQVQHHFIPKAQMCCRHIRGMHAAHAWGIVVQCR